MYEAYFGLTEKPFSIAPDPRYMYLSEAHEEALAHLLFGVQQGGGFVQLTGEVGTGKTTLIRTLLDQLPDHVDLALVFNPKLSPLEFVAAICDELKVEYDNKHATLKTLVDALNEHLLVSYLDGRRTVLIIDEAQGLSVDVLEQVRLLTNLETTKEKLLQIILVGQPELRTTLRRDDLRQLAQRVTDVYHLEPLNLEEVKNYLIHRLTIAGSKKNLFTDSAARAIYKSSGGIPRLINEISDKALLGAYAGEKRLVDRTIARHAATQVFARFESDTGMRWWWGVAAGITIVAVVTSLYIWREQGEFSLQAMFQSDSDAGIARQRVYEESDVPMLIQNGVSTPLLAQQVEPSVVTQVVEEQVSVPHSVKVESVQVSEQIAFDLEDWLIAHAGELTRANAFAAVFDSWNISSEELNSGELCQQALAAGLKCLSLQGNWNRLSDIDRPAILSVNTNDQRIYYLPIISMDDDVVSVISDGVVKKLSRDVIDKHWFGEFELLWQIPPPGDETVLSPGDEGPEIEWLRDRLTEITGIDVEPVDSIDLFDEKLAEVVRIFQVMNRLRADSVVGPQTIIRLNSASPVYSGPRLKDKG